MRDTIVTRITRKPILSHGRKTDLVLFSICFLFLLFSAFVVSPTKGGPEARVPGEQTASNDRPAEVRKNEDRGARIALPSGETLLIAVRSDLNEKRIMSRR